jgi:hypothetical protein
MTQDNSILQNKIEKRRYILIQFPKEDTVNSIFSPLNYYFLYQTAFVTSIHYFMFHVAAVSGCLSARCNCDLNAVCRFLLLVVQNTLLAFLSTQNSNRTLSVKWKRNCWKRTCRRNDTVKLTGCFESRVLTSDILCVLHRAL